MSSHRSAVFNNSCLKVPRKLASKKSCTDYDQRILDELIPEHRKHNESINKDKYALKSFIEFYDSIPEYDDVNHLSNKEFYRKLEALKDRQKTFFDSLRSQIKYENRDTGWLEEYGKFGKDKNEETESLSSMDKEVTTKPPSRRSVRIESPSEKRSDENTPDVEYFRSKSRLDVSSASTKRNKTVSPFNESLFRIEIPKRSKDNTPDAEYFRSKSRLDVSSACTKRNKTVSPFNESLFDDFSDLEREETLTTKSAPSSPRKVGWKDGITIPKPFQMTVRDEENKIVDELIVQSKPKDGSKSEMFRAHPIPIESQIPLFDKIMYDKERRRQVVKKKSKAALRAQMKPFSFTKREEEIEAITKRLSKSSPCLFINHEEPIKVHQFRAKPVPKNLFSNYIYRKMHEDEFYRALQRKIRSEEMLKAASLPPAMAKREKTKLKFHVCPRSLKFLDSESTPKSKLSKNKAKYSNLEKELEELELDFINDTPTPTSKKKFRNGKRKKSVDNTKRSRCQSALESVNRSNLAAVLRIQSARKRMEDEISRRLEQVRIKEEARWREKVLRKRPVWEALAYSHEEDLNMRLQLRRDEERLRKEEHRQKMQSMIGRVNQQPTLFERQSQARSAKTREELISKLYGNIARYNASPKFSSGISDRSVVEMKDEAIQAYFDEIFKAEEEAAVEGNDTIENEDEIEEKEE